MSIEAWCIENGYTDPQKIEGRWWAFPEGAFLPVPVPVAYRDAADAIAVPVSISLTQEQIDRVLSALSQFAPKTFRYRHDHEEFCTLVGDRSSHDAQAIRLLSQKSKPLPFEELSAGYGDRP